MSRKVRCSNMSGGIVTAIITLAALMLLLLIPTAGGGLGPQSSAAADRGTFHYATAIDGNIAVVGAQWHNGFKGTAYVLLQENGEWVLAQTLTPDDPGRYDHFGSAVAIDGESIYIEAPWHDSFKGAVYTFERVDGKWVQRAKRSGMLANRIESTEEPGASSSAAGSLVDAIALAGIDTEPPLLPAVAPGPVDSIIVTDAMLEERVEIKWFDQERDAIIYQILRDGSLLSIAASDESLYVDTTGNLEQSYEYCVVVKNMAGEESTPVCANGSRIIFPPASVNASDGQYTNRVTVNWVDVSWIEEGYYLYRNGALIDSAGSNAVSLDDSTAVPDTRYNYEVRAFVKSVSPAALSTAASDSGWRGTILPPLDLSASDGQYLNRVVITWKDQAPDELGYRIYRDGVLIDSTGIADPSGTIVTYEDTAVASDTTYTYCVATKGAGGIESIRMCDQGATGLTAPGNVSASDSTYDDRIVITWDDLSDYEDGYEIRREVSAAMPASAYRPAGRTSQEFGSATVLDTTAANREEYVDYTASPDTIYTYYVRAVNDSGGVSPPAADDGYQAIVLAPVDIAASDGDYEDHVEITWESNSTTAVLFKIYRDTTFIKSLSENYRSYNDYGGIAGQPYDYSVVAATAMDTEAEGASDQGRRELAPPTSLAASDEEHEDKIVISWSDRSQLEHGYVVTRFDTSEASVDTSYTIGPNRQSFTDYSAVPGITYRYSVAAFDSSGGAVGYSQTAEDLGRRVLLAPTEVAADDGKYEEQVEITWLDNSNAEDGYHIYCNGAFIGKTGDNFTTFVDTLPVLGQKSEYTVAAFDSVPFHRMGESEAASDSGYTTILAPVSFNASDGYEDRIELTWIDVSQVETGFEIWRDDGPYTPQVLRHTTGPDTTFYTDIPPDLGTTYQYCIKAVRNSSLVSTEVCDQGTSTQPVGLEPLSLLLKLDPSDGKSGDYFGSSLSISRNTVVVGATRTDDYGSASGSAYIFQRNTEGDWTEKQELHSPHPGGYRGFGNSSATSGGVAIIGEYASSYHEWMGGAVWVFERNSDTGLWEYSYEIESPVPEAAANFGGCVSMSGNTAMVGACYQDPDSSGIVYVYEREDTSSIFNYSATISSPDAGTKDNFGYNLWVSGDRAIIGARGKDGRMGAAYIFENNGGWTYKATLTASDRATGDEFGFRVALAGDVAVVGARLEDDNGPGSGSAYVFVRDSGGNWQEQQKLTASDGGASDHFGCAVSIYGGSIIIGAEATGSGGSGAAYIFNLDPVSGVWKQTKKLTPAGAEIGDAFGYSTVIGEDAVIIGAVGNDGHGSAYVLEIPNAPTNVSASDGTLDSRVRIRWEDVSSNEDGFHIYRDGEMLEPVSPNVEVFEDYDAQPGRTYKYSVAAYRNELPVELDRVSDFGWRPPNGNITGRVSAVGGGASQGIYVELDPEPTRALLFDGAGGRVAVADPEHTFDFSSEDSYTLELWFKYRGNGGSGTGDGTLIAKSSMRAGKKKFPFWLSTLRSESDPGHIRFAVCDSITAVGVTSHDDSLNDNTWHHVACVHDAEQHELKMYIDGMLEGITPYVSLQDISTIDSVSIGAGAVPESWFGGEIDDVRIWNIARTASDIQTLMKTPLTGEEPGLVGYWPLDENSRGVMTDPFDAGHYGVFDGGVYWTDDNAPIDITVQTDQTGSFVLRNLRYANETTFKVRPFKENRQFEPPYTMITLSVDHPVENQVNFSDISSYTVSGRILYESTACPAADVSILVDSQIAGTTDKNGKFAVSVNNGFHSIRPDYGDHIFSPDSMTATVTNDTSGFFFDDLTTRTLSGYVGGGCGRAIGDVTITVRSENDCMEREYVCLSGDSTYSMLLPPQNYLVSASVDASTIPEGMDQLDVMKFFQNLGVRMAEMDSFDVAMDFTYRAPLVVRISGLEEYVEECDGPLSFENRILPDKLPVVPQGTRLTLIVEVNENYGTGRLCPLDSATVVIYDELFDRENEPFELEIRNGVASFNTYTSTPSLVIGRVDELGRDRSFQKAVHAVVTVEGRTPVTKTEWVLVTGHLAAAGADFVTGIVNVPLYILRDPPGDDSFAFLEKETELKTRIEWGKELVSFSAGANIHLEWGADLDFFIGLGAGKQVELSIHTSRDDRYEVGTRHEVEWTTDVVIKNKERFLTSTLDHLTSGRGDVFIGAGYNIIFSEVTDIEVQDCAVTKSTQIGFQPDSIPTLYTYTAQYIADVLIPELQDKVDYFTTHEEEDSVELFQAQVNMWQNQLARNDSLKAAASLIENRSFSAGAEFSYTSEHATESSYTYTGTILFENEHSGLGARLELEGSFLDWKFFMKLENENLGFFDYSTGTNSTAIGYTFIDDDIGDHFSVDIKDDGCYPSPVFDVIAGASSCPYEPWPDPDSGDPQMMARDKPALFIAPLHLYDVPPDEPAVFTLSLSNQSPTKEDRPYVVRLLSSSNRDGAVVKIGGMSILNGLDYFIEADSTYNIALTVERGPTNYSYEDLELLMYPLCLDEYNYGLWDLYGPLEQAERVKFSVFFDAPCSEITLYLPESGWIYDKADEDGSEPIELWLTDYEHWIGESPDDTLLSVWGEYRYLGSDGEGPSEWTSIDADSVGATHTVIEWNPPATLKDGVYELRAYSHCAGGNGYSESAIGTIDRHAPSVFGTPEPSDGVLSFGEDISVTFNELIECGSVDLGTVSLTYADGPNEGSAIARTLVCNGREIIIKPEAAADSLEGRRLRASVDGVVDLIGNPMEAEVSWEFDYRKNRFAWQNAHLTAGLAYRAPATVMAELVNGTADAVDFTIAIPDSMEWITSVTPAAGTIAPGGTKSVGFVIDDSLAIGIYRGQIAAEAGDPGQGVAVLDLTLDVACQEPGWEFDPGDYLYTMTIVAKIDIGGAWSNDTNDRLAAFVGGELRGVANVSYHPAAPEPYLAYLTVYSNQAAGEMVHFQVWDNDSCTLYNATDRTVAFVDNGTYGSAGTPEIFIATMASGSGVLTIPVNEGWNWISTNIVSGDMSADAVLSHLSPAPGDIIKAKDGSFAQYEDSLGWEPPFVLDNVSGYLLHLSQSGTIMHIGTQVDVTAEQLPVSTGWNWISYLPEDALSVTAALDSLRLKNIVSDEDIIKSQTGFAQYVSGDQAWYGNLDEMEAGQGYSLYLDRSGSFDFGYPEPEPGVMPPLAVAPAPGAGGDPAPPVEGAPPWSVDCHAYQYNMTVTAVLKVDGVESIDENDIIGAFVGDECRGTAHPVDIPGIARHEVFLMIHSNETAGETVMLKAFDAAAGCVRDIDEDLAYEVNKVVGRLSIPFVLHATSGEEQDTGIPPSFALMQNVPNPFNPVTSIRYDVPDGGGMVTLRIYDVGGRLVRTLVDAPQTPGRKTATWYGRDNNGEPVATGVYFYKMTAPGFERTRKMVLLK